MPQNVIPTERETRGNYSQRTVLDGREYLLLFRWNQREGRWYLTISDQDGAPIVSGVKIVVNFPLITNRIVDARRPPGEIFATDTTGADIDPGLDDLGSRVVLIYIDAADIPGPVGVDISAPVDLIPED